MKKGLLLFTVIMSFAGCSPRSPEPMNQRANLYYETGVGYLNKGDTEEALNTLKEAEKMAPKSGAICNAIGLCYLNMNILNLSLTYAQKACELDTKNSEFRNNLANIYRSIGKYDDALREINVVLADPEYRTPGAAYFNRGMIMVIKGDTEQGEKDFLRAIKLDPFFDLPYIKLGKLYLEKGQYDEAINMLNYGMKINNKNPEVFLLRGEARWQRGYITSAENDFNQVLNLVPDGSAYARLARTWLNKIK